MIPIVRRLLFGAVAVALTVAVAVWARAAQEEESVDFFPRIDFDHPAIQYQTHPTRDIVTRLQKQINNGEVTLDYDPNFGYLPSLLKHLDVNRDSQMLVFSKTSFQAPKISPRSPRVLYFNDEAAVGFVPQGEIIELAAVDPENGVDFYTLDGALTAKPQFVRPQMDCIQCHMLSATLNVAGLFVESVIPLPDGTPRSLGESTLVDSRTALKDRWGGWYVTGTTGELRHRGNTVVRSGMFDTRRLQNVKSLSGIVDTTPYLEPTSDIVALMTLEHQTRMTNLLIRLGWETRIAVQEGKLEEFKKQRLQAVIDQVVEYMLFAGEAKMDEPIAGVSTFTKTFPERGPRDAQGRSLRDFDLQKRLFRYPLSYMIYSAVFDALPDLAKDGVYRRLFEVLTAKDTSETFARLSTEDRRAVFEIVRDTKPGVPAYWK